MPVNTAIRSTKENQSVISKVLFTGVALIAIYYLIKLDGPPPVTTLLRQGNSVLKG